MIKNFLKLLFCFFLVSSPAYSLVDEPSSETNKPKLKHYQGEILADEIIKLNDTIDGDTIEGVDFFDDDKLDFKLFSEYAFAKKKAIKFKEGPVDEFSGELRFKGINSFENIGDSMTSTYPFDINAVIESKFFENKFRFFTEYAFTRDVSDLDHEFFGKFSNLYIEQNFSNNHKMRIGTSRAPIGLEGSMSSFSLPLINRAQISRNFGDAIATGVSFLGNKNGFEYNLGGYTSTRFTQGFDDGAEFIGRIGYQPFYKSEGSYFKDLTFYTGADVGHRQKDYQVYSAAVNYEYKKLLMNVEYAYANGSNGDYFVPDKRQGFFTTLGWNFTPNVQLLLRYDCFDPNTSKSGDLNHEYTVGLNYFIFKQRLRFAVNYVFKDNDARNSQSNAIYFLTQFFI